MHFLFSQTSFLLILVVSVAAVLASPVPGVIHHPVFDTHPVAITQPRLGEVKQYHPTWLQISRHYAPRVHYSPLDSIHVDDIVHGVYDGGLLKPYGGYGKLGLGGHKG